MHFPPQQVFIAWRCLVAGELKDGVVGDIFAIKGHLHGAAAPNLTGTQAYVAAVFGLNSCIEIECFYCFSKARVVRQLGLVDSRGNAPRYEFTRQSPSKLSY